MATIPQAFIDSVIEQADIVAIIDERVPLKKSGLSMQACCPFHDEKSPSFTVTPAKKMYYCFGCGAGGNAITFVMEYDGVDFPSAVRSVAAHVGMAMPATQSINKVHPPTQENPNATADAYMSEQRGFDISRIKGWYSQSKWWSIEANTGTETVLFPVADGVSMERFCDTVWIDDGDKKSPRKQTFTGTYKGLWWQPPQFEINDGDEIYITEAVIDSISLNLSGFKSVAVLTCNNYPDVMLEQHGHKEVTWIWALDNDKAGIGFRKADGSMSGTRGHVNRMREEGLTVTAAQPGKPFVDKCDWNDHFKAGALTPKHMNEYRHLGALLVAKTALEKAVILWKKKNKYTFHFDFNRQLYWFNLNVEAYTKALEDLNDVAESEGDTNHEEDSPEVKEAKRMAAAEASGSLSKIANCLPTFLYYQRNEVTDESWYYCKIEFPHGGAAIKNTFTGAQIAGAADFKKRLLHIAPLSQFTGTTKQLERFVERDEPLKVVSTVDFIGYSKLHKCYVFNDFAVSNGKLTTINNEDYFDLENVSIKTLNKSITLHRGDKQLYKPEWSSMLWECFGEKGIVALVFWFGSLFAEQIRQEQKSFPFLELIGEAGSGKSTLVEFLWKLVGRTDYEGFDPNKSSPSARARNFSQVSGLPIVLLESDRSDDGASHYKKMDWDELKTAYNGRAIMSRGVKNGGNETYEPPFRATIVITQNAEVVASDAVLQRIVHINVDKSGHNARTKVLSEQLERMPVDNVSYFLQLVLENEQRILGIMAERFRRYEMKLLAEPKIKTVRIAKNHAQMMALFDSLNDLVGFGEEIRKKVLVYMKNMAIKRQETILADHPIVALFWEQVEYFEERNNHIKSVLNHSKNNDLMAINLNHYIQIAADNKQQTPLITDLKKALKTGRKYKFVEIKPVSSTITDTTVKCWVFEKPKEEKKQYQASLSDEGPESDWMVA